MKLRKWMTAVLGALIFLGVALTVTVLSRCLVGNATEYRAVPTHRR